LAASTSGCTIILTGDYHWTDIKVLKAGEPADGYYGVANALYNSPGGAREFPASGVVQVCCARSLRFLSLGCAGVIVGLKLDGE